MVKKETVHKNLNYHVLIEKEFYDNGKAVYNVVCPTLGVFDYGPTIEEALKSLKDGITTTIEYLDRKRVSGQYLT